MMPPKQRESGLWTLQVHEKLNNGSNKKLKLAGVNFSRSIFKTIKLKDIFVHLHIFTLKL